jgi:hypothetical protein
VQVREIRAADDPAGWARLGFAVDDTGAVRLGDVMIRLHAPASAEAGGLTSLGLAGVDAAALDGIALHRPTAEPAPGAPPAHRNGALAVDHVVVTTPALGRTLDAFDHAGLELRRVRDVPGERSLRQAFFVAGPCVLEVVGPLEDEGDGPARLWGVTLVVADVDDLARRLDPLLGRPRDAVQPGRRIVTARREAGISVPLAFITPRRPRQAVRVERT